MVKEAAAVLGEGFEYIAANGLQSKLREIALGHIMRMAGRDELLKQLSEKAVGELDYLFSLMAMRALDKFTLAASGKALAMIMRGQARGGPETEPELVKLIEKRAKATAVVEAAQLKVVAAAAAKKPFALLKKKRTAAEREVHRLTSGINALSGLSGAVT